MKRIAGGIISSMAICSIMAIFYGVNHHPEPNTYNWSVISVFFFYLFYILPPILVGGVFFSLLVDAIAKKFRGNLSSLKSYLISFAFYAILGMLAGFLYIYLILGGRDPLMWLYGALSSLLFFHILLLLRKNQNIR